MPDTRRPAPSTIGRGITQWLRGTAPDEATPVVEPSAPPPASPRPGGDVQVMQLRVDPRRVRIWPGNARVYALLNEANCRDLIDSILAEGGQKMPAIVRPVADDPHHDFEVIAGTRRHFAISWLRDHGRFDLHFLVQVEALDDEAAFRLADLENRARNDVSDFERARNYAAALADHYDGHLTRMAERLNLSKGWLSKMIRIASLPDAVIGAFADPRDLRLRAAYALAQAMEPEEAGWAVIAMATQIGRAQAARIADGHTPYTAAEILRSLMAAAGSKDAPIDYVHPGPNGPALSLVSVGKSGVTVKLHAGSGAKTADLIAGLKALIEKLAEGGHKLG